MMVSNMENMNSIDSFLEFLDEELPGIIRKIAIVYNIQAFINDADFLEERMKKWHQFGVLNHTKRVRQAFSVELDPLLKQWGISEQIEKILNEEIDGIKKKKLLELSIPLHDLGKIPVYGDERINREHELCSKNLLSENLLKQKLSILELSEKQKQYLEKCIETHDIIGKEIRDALKHESHLNLSFLSNQRVIDLCKELALKYQDIKTEIGIYFLCDSLGKTDIRLTALTDEEIVEKEQEIIELLEQKSLPQELKHGIMQLPINIKLAEVYLKSLSR